MTTYEIYKKYFPEEEFSTIVELIPSSWDIELGKSATESLVNIIKARLDHVRNRGYL